MAKKSLRVLELAGAASLAALMFAGCAAPIGADRVSTLKAYGQVNANALRTGDPGPATVSILHRYDLARLAAKHPDEAVRRLHEKALATGERDLLFALSELSYVAGEHIRRGVKPWDPRDPRDFYLGSAVYAYLFLFGEGKDPLPGPFERRFGEARDFYNCGLGLALLEAPRATNATVRLENGRRNLPVGSITIHTEETSPGCRVCNYEQLLLADQFRVRGLSVRNRQSGLGAPLICVEPVNEEFGIQRSESATAFLRLPTSLAEISKGGAASIELYPALTSSNVTVAGTQVPLEIDLTTYRAYTLNQASIWVLGPLQFLAPSERVRSQLILNQPYSPGRIPVVFVHGTFSSPVTWAEMANSLTADPELRRRCQFWSFIYGSGNPLAFSAAELRSALTDTVQKLDPEGKDPALHDMVVIGHSQGGLLTKLTAIETGDKIWRVFSTNRIEDLKVSESDRQKLRRLTYLEPLPFVRRVVFISTPHRGSYLAGSFARSFARRLMSAPKNLVARSETVINLARGSQSERFLSGKMPTSLDSMSPRNPVLRAMAEIPVNPPIKANSIIAVQGNGDYHLGRDGLVTYDSAHQDYAESEFIVRSYHTCLEEPATIEEVRRILHEHIDELPGDKTPQ